MNAQISPVTMTPTIHEKREWFRFAQTLPASLTRHNLYMFSGLPDGASMNLGDFDELQRAYRAWLVFGVMPS
jgi:hypothetical protein